MTATIARPQPADLLYGRLLATAVQHVLGGGPPPLARVRAADGTSEPLALDRWSAIVELDPSGTPSRRTRVRLEAPGVVSEWFAWARLGVDDVRRVAGRARLETPEVRCPGDRWFARLRRP